MRQLRANRADGQCPQDWRLLPVRQWVPLCLWSGCADCRLLKVNPPFLRLYRLFWCSYLAEPKCYRCRDSCLHLYRRDPKIEYPILQGCGVRWFGKCRPDWDPAIHAGFGMRRLPRWWCCRRLNPIRPKPRSRVWQKNRLPVWCCRRRVPHRCRWCRCRSNRGRVNRHRQKPNRWRCGCLDCGGRTMHLQSLWWQRFLCRLRPNLGQGDHGHSACHLD